MKYNTVTKQVSERVHGGVYEGMDYHGEPPADVAARAGWVDVTPAIQAQIDAYAAKAAKASADAEAARLKAIKEDLDTIDAALGLLDAAAIDPSTFTGAQRDTIKAVKEFCTGLRTAVKNAKQAIAKIREGMR